MWRNNKYTFLEFTQDAASINSVVRMNTAALHKFWTIWNFWCNQLCIVYFHRQNLWINTVIRLSNMKWHLREEDKKQIHWHFSFILDSTSFFLKRGLFHIACLNKLQKQPEWMRLLSLFNKWSFFIISRPHAHLIIFSLLHVWLISMNLYI